MFRIPHLRHLHLLRVSHEHPPEKILFKTASIMQIASILLNCKLSNTIPNTGSAVQELPIWNFLLKSNSLLQHVINPQTFLGKQKAFTKQAESLFSELRAPVLPGSAFPDLLFCHLRGNSISRGIRHLYPKTLQSDTLHFNHRENLAENLELANAQHEEWKDIGKIKAIHRTPVAGDHVKVQPS